MPRLVPELRKMVGTLSMLSGLGGNRLVPEVQTGKLDMIITSEAPGRRGAASEAHTLIREPFVLLLPKGTRPAGTAAETWSRLIADYSPSGVHGPRRRMSALIGPATREDECVDLPRTLEFASSAPIIDLVRQDLAWTIHHAAYVSIPLGSPFGELTVVPILRMLFSRKVELAAPAGRLATCPRVSRISVGASSTRTSIPQLKEPTAPLRGRHRNLQQ